MINFLKVQYQLGKITDEQLDLLVENKQIKKTDLKVIKGNHV